MKRTESEYTQTIAILTGIGSSALFYAYINARLLLASTTQLAQYVGFYH